MPISSLETQLKAYREWKTVLTRTIDDYRAWMERHRLLTRDSDRRIRQCRKALNDDRINIAFVAEFSRGKTELINAIFFADYGRRLLPSTAGRTTMCPTEMFYDHEAGEAYIQLLPIETRLQDKSLDEWKEEPEAWVHHTLDTDSADQVETKLREVVQTRQVSLDEALRLGLYDPGDNPHHSNPPDRVEIPKWRHARISFPHPLLKRGISILDTPGLNALGSEPELTLSTLPSAQAILFVLATDTGVTHSDLEIWQNHIKGSGHRRHQGRMVVMNKMDALWDDLQAREKIEQEIERQCMETAAILGVKRNVVFPISAQKGLLAKIRGDDTLLQRSGLPALEQYLSHDILNSRKEIIQDTISAEIAYMLENTIGIVSSKRRSLQSQLTELEGLSGKSQEVIEHLIEESRQEKKAYREDINSFNASRKILNKQADRLLHTLDLERLEQKIETAHREMSGNWTTRGLRNSMRQLFDELRRNMQQVVDESEQARKLIRGIYRRFQSEHGFSIIQPKMFSIMRYRVELEMLYQEAEIFRNSPVMAATEKRFVIKRFFNVMVARARMIFTAAQQEVSDWLRSVLDPLALQVQQHRQQLTDRLEDLQKISRSRNTLQARVDELKKQERAIAHQLVLLRNMYSSLNQQQALAEGQRPRPRLVSNRSG